MKVLQSESENKGRIAVKFTHTPSDMSWKQLVHYGQIIKAKQFQRYDLGTPALNLEKYGQEQPPKYNLTKFPLKMAIVHGELDFMADPSDVAWLLDE